MITKNLNSPRRLYRRVEPQLPVIAGTGSGQVQVANAALVSDVKNLDQLVSMPSNTPVTSSTFDPRQYALEILRMTPFCTFGGELYVYKTAPFSTQFGVYYGGRYYPVTGVELNNVTTCIARCYSEVLASLKNVNGPVSTILDFIRVYASIIVLDESQNRNNMIFCDATYIDLENGWNFQLQSFGPEKFFSTALTVTGAEFMAASSQPPSCVVWLSQIEGGYDWRNWMRCCLEALGYLISGSPEKRVVVLQGVNDSFKSTLFNTIVSVLPKGYVYTQNFSDLGSKFGLDTIEGARILSISDAESGKINPKSTSCLKRISGQDDLRINIKYKSGLSTHIDVTIVITANYDVLPDDLAAESRCACISFPVPILDPVVASDLAFRFKTEAVQLFKSALVAHLVRVSAERKLLGYAPLNSCTMKTATAFAWTHMLNDFVRYALIPDKTQNVSKRQIHDAFCQTCVTLGIPEKPEFDEFCRAFNNVFSAIRPKEACKLTVVRVPGEDGTVQGAKDFAINVDQFLAHLQLQ